MYFQLTENNRLRLCDFDAIIDIDVARCLCKSKECQFEGSNVPLHCHTLQQNNNNNSRQYDYVCFWIPPLCFQIELLRNLRPALKPAFICQYANRCVEYCMRYWKLCFREYGIDLSNPRGRVPAIRRLTLKDKEPLTVILDYEGYSGLRRTARLAVISGT